MKKIIITLFLITAFSYAKVNTIVSVLPQESLVKEIGGDKVDVTLMVEPGNSPHTYEPKPSQMKAISKADIYFAIEVEFENSWLPKFANQNKNMKIINIAKGVEKIAMQNHHHQKSAKKDNQGGTKDPHIWTSPKNIAIIATNIYNSLVQIDNQNKNYYKENLDRLLLKVKNLDEKIKTILSNSKNAKFMVFHPAWGYFAKEYNLIQIPIEIDGKNPKPKEIVELIKEAREERVKVIFTAPEFSEKIAQIIANELSIDVIKISPLNPNWAENLEKLAKDIVK